MWFPTRIWYVNPVSQTKRRLYSFKLCHPNIDVKLMLKWPFLNLLRFPSFPIFKFIQNFSLCAGEVVSLQWAELNIKQNLYPVIWTCTLKFMLWPRFLFDSNAIVEFSSRDGAIKHLKLLLQNRCGMDALAEIYGRDLRWWIYGGRFQNWTSAWSENLEPSWCFSSSTQIQQSASLKGINANIAECFSQGAYSSNQATAVQTGSERGRNLPASIQVLSW